PAHEAAASRRPYQRCGAQARGGAAVLNTSFRMFPESAAATGEKEGEVETTGEISPAPCGGDRRSGRIEAHRDYLLGLIRRSPDMTLLEIQERLIANCGERFAVSLLWRFFDRHEISSGRPPYIKRRCARTRCDSAHNNGRRP